MASPGVIFKMKFVCAHETIQAFGDYIDYIDKPEKFPKEIYETDMLYSGHIDYMGNEDKSDGVFDSKFDRLFDKRIKYHREMLDNAKAQDCPLYQGVISFDNAFLEEYGLIVDDKVAISRLKKETRLGVAEMIKASHLDENNVEWTAAIHTNTDNIHIHLALIEKRKVERKKDMIEKQAFEKLKSRVANGIIGDRHLRELEQIFRKDLLKDVKAEAQGSPAKMFNLIEPLPQGVRWQYNSNQMHGYQAMIDKYVLSFIYDNESLAKKFDEGKEALKKYEELVKRLYGEGSNEQYKAAAYNKMQDFYSRAGNAVLSSISEKDEDGRSLLQDYFQMKKAKRELMGLKIQASREKSTKLYERKLGLRESLFATRKANRSARRCITRLSREIEREIEMLEHEYEYEQSISRRI